MKSDKDVISILNFHNHIQCQISCNNFSFLAGYRRYENPFYKVGILRALCPFAQMLRNRYVQL